MLILLGRGNKTAIQRMLGKITNIKTRTNKPLVELDMTISKIELKKKLRSLGIKVEGNYIRKGDVKKAISLI